MKNIFAILVIFGFSLLLGQTYKFDKLITTELKGKTGILVSTEQRLVNSENDHYYLKFSDQKIVELWDMDQHKFHVFNYSEGKNEVIFFNYLYSCENNIEEQENNNWDFRVEKINDTEYVLGKYKSKKSKKPIFSQRIFLEESDRNQIHYLGHIKPFYDKELMKIMDVSKKYIIKKMTFYPNGKEAKTLELINIIDNNLEIKLPKNLNYNCESKFYK